jgi:hypothetical protein
MQEITQRENLNYQNQFSTLENNDFKPREFGKDITNSFIGTRKSIEQNNKFGKQTKVADLKSQGLRDPKKTQTMNFVPNRFGIAPRQTQVNNIKKPLKKQSCFIPNHNQTQMEIDSFNSYNPSKTEIDNQEVDNSNMTMDYFNYNTINDQSNQFNSIPLNLKPEPQQIVSSNNINDVNYNVMDVSMNFKTNDTVENLVLPHNIQEVPEYSHSIFLHLKETEFLHPEYYPVPNYMKNQNDINDKMRAILYDWLVDVHLKFKLLPETLFLTFNLIDRYLNRKIILRSKLQLIGVASMLIACKYEEIYAPEVKDFVYITDKAYTAEEVKHMELDILAVLQFDVTMPSAYRFTEFFHHFIGYNKLVLNFTLYLLELSIVDYKMLRHKVSLIAAASIYVSSKLLHKENICYNEAIEFDLEKLYDLSGYSEEEIKECAKDVCMIYDNSDKTGLCAIKKKFALPKYDQVSKIKFGK